MHKNIHENLQMKPKLGAMASPFIVEEGLKMGGFQTFSKTGSVDAGPNDQRVAPCYCSQLPTLLNEPINVEHVIW
jgi:hypothetical protein